MGDEIVYPKGLSSTLYEVELAVVISKPAKHVKAVNALDYVFGCICFNDISGYDLPGVFGKGTDTFSPMGPCIATGLDPSNLRLQTWIICHCVTSPPTRGGEIRKGFDGGREELVRPDPSGLGWG